MISDGVNVFSPSAFEPDILAAIFPSEIRVGISLDRILEKILG